MTWFIIIFAVLTGMLMPLQAGVNSHLAKYLSQPIHAGFVSFLGGFLAMTCVCLISRKFFPAPSHIAKVPPHLLIGGFLGVIFVMTTIVLAPKLGATVLVSCLITGQLVASLVLDHYGFLGFPVHSVNFMRVVGVLFLFTGVIFVKTF